MKCLRGVVVLASLATFVVVPTTLGLTACGAGVSAVEVVPEMVISELGIKSDVRWVEACGGWFSTDFDEGMKNRSVNLRVACGVIDGVELAPGAVFSFNEHVGLATREKGYLPAKIFVGGKETEGLGGGICQLSSTLYNAADLMGLEIVERHPHSRRVYYVEVGRDASTAYGGKDLKFRNDFDYPVRVRASAVGGKNLVWFERPAF